MKKRFVFLCFLWFIPRQLKTFIYEQFRSQMKQDYPLDLSILLRGGKETNKDSLSSGE